MQKLEESLIILTIVHKFPKEVQDVEFHEPYKGRNDKDDVVEVNNIVDELQDKEPANAS